jgi:catechol 2,3-dioxygenase-like lactoylglutathione lyase family enzyme
MARKGLSHIALKVPDLKKTEKFYVDVLGLKVAFRHPPKMLFLTTPGSGDLINFVKAQRRATANQGLEHLGFKVSPAALRRMERKMIDSGVAIDGRRGRSAFYISDPDGYQIEFYCD